ncbi:MAG: NADH-quinone oxidoreductase subunit J [Chloroflexi bacterium]|nr:NADH-quinone oxidoreductase subunit J [Chloroflexota bacterium]
MTLILFAFLALIALAGGLGVVLSRNPVHSALSLLLNFASIAVIYFLLHAQFLGVVQVIVYAGAIVVLFLFVVMLIGGNIGPYRHGSRTVTSVIAVGLAAAFLALVVWSVVQVLPMSATPVGAPDAGSVQAVGMALYTDYLVPFELASLLLLVGMLGGVVLARRYQPFAEDETQ